MSGLSPSAPDPARVMRDAIALSEAVRGTTHPNPPVGAVICDAGGAVVGQGATEPPGGPHAEVMALRQAGAWSHGGTAFVTLEPCAHHGRTPPCAQALIEAGIAQVHYAVADPSELAAGGAAALADAGVKTTLGPLTAEVERGPLRAWLHYVRTGRPHVTWKFASTLDGRVAAADGTSRWISSAASRADTHELRAKVDAVVVGTATVLADDPQLTARREDGTPHPRQPLRVVVGDRDIPAGARILDDAAETMRVRGHDPGGVLAQLAKRGALDVVLEGGPRVAGAFMRAGMVDRIIGYLAPALLGAGPWALEDAGVSTITEMHRWAFEEVTMTGGDVRVTAVPSSPGLQR